MEEFDYKNVTALHRSADIPAAAMADSASRVGQAQLASRLAPPKPGVLRTESPVAHDYR